MRNLLLQTFCQEYIVIAQTKMKMNHQMNMNHYQSDFEILLPSPTVELASIFSQLSLFSKQRLDTDDNGQGQLSQQQIKGLKFISSKLAKLFAKNRKLPYNQISKILIDNFAHEQKDERNIKRRVYDAINVLVSAGILIKKNNSIQMVKNKIKTKIQYDRRGQIQDQIKEKQELLSQKRDQHSQLVHKHKLIRKLFERNQRMGSIRQGRLKKTRTRNQQSKEGKEGKDQRALVAATQLNSSLDGVIYEPRVFIFSTGNTSGKKLQKCLLQNFTSENQLQVMVPFKKSGFSPIILQQTRRSKSKKWMGEMDVEMEDEFMRQDIRGVEEDSAIVNNEQSDEEVSKLVSEYGIYTLLDLLELLTLEERAEDAE